MRRDAALYEAAPKKTGKAGRPRKKGKRLLSPAAMAAKLRDAAFTSVTVEWRGGTKDLLVWSRPVLWYTVDKEHLVQLVIVRDPTRRMHDDFFVTTDLDASPAWVTSHYAGRWSIECINREVKQVIGADPPLYLWRFSVPVGSRLNPTVPVSSTWLPHEAPYSLSTAVLPVPG